MQEFMRKFTQLNGTRVSVVLEHCLFDTQRFICPSLKTIDNDDRIGVCLRGHEIYIYRQDIKVAEVSGDTYMISDGRLTININKL